MFSFIKSDKVPSLTYVVLLNKCTLGSKMEHFTNEVLFTVSFLFFILKRMHSKHNSHVFFLFCFVCFFAARTIASADTHKHKHTTF